MTTQQPLVRSLDRSICQACRIQPPRHHILAGSDYESPIDGVVIALKFGGQIHLADTLGWLCAKACLQPSRSLPAPDGRQHVAPLDSTLADDPPDVVTAVPLGRGRLERRGYNHAALIANRFIRHLDHSVGIRLPVDTGLIERHRNTTPQSSLARRTDRLGNVDGAFRVVRRAAGRHVLLIDDAVTSGATAMACADALVHGGARRVTIVTATRTPLHASRPPTHCHASCSTSS